MTSEILRYADHLTLHLLRSGHFAEGYNTRASLEAHSVFVKEGTMQVYLVSTEFAREGTLQWQAGPLTENRGEWTALATAVEQVIVAAGVSVKSASLAAAASDQGPCCGEQCK